MFQPAFFDTETGSGISKIDKSGMGGTLGAPVHKGLKARTEASRSVPMPDTAKDHKFTKKCQKTQFNL
ncbi:MAG: hypothetical protein P9L94_00275 [Candidatus Hinthialibacter antarcticus]|nr:hypothetical protein [Candidatus Hinthialibacter antarcticus]